MTGDNTKIFKHFIHLATISAFTSSTEDSFHILLTDFVCLLSLCKIVRSSVILLLPLFTSDLHSVKTKTTLEDNRRCLSQVLFPDTHSRNLIRLDRYSLIVPGRRVPFSSSRSITSLASPTVSSRKILSELSSDRKKRIPVR